VTLILTIIDVIGYIVNAAAGSIVTANLVYSILGVIFTIYKMWVVYAFIQEIKSDNARLGFQSRLEDGTGGPVFQMQSYPPYAQQTPAPGYPVQQPYTVHGQGPYVVQQIGPGPNQNIIYNPNSPYATTGNVQ